MVKICTRCLNSFPSDAVHDDCPMDLPGTSPGRERRLWWPVRVRVKPFDWAWKVTRTTKLIVVDLKHVATTYHLGPFVVQVGETAEAFVDRDAFVRAITKLYMNGCEFFQQEQMKLLNRHLADIQALQAAHENAHKSHDECVRVMCESVSLTMQRLDAFAAELEAAGHSTRAERLIEITTTLIWALEDKTRRLRVERGHEIKEEQNWLQ